MHASRSEWLFFRELRVGTGRRNGNVQRLDAFALNYFPHTGMKRVCYEVKGSRSDFLAELKQPLKRRIGMRYSNDFYFVTPAGLVDIAEIPAECGLVEAGVATANERKDLIRRQAELFSFDSDTRRYCVITIPAPWRDTPGPTWQLVGRHAAESTAGDGGEAAGAAGPATAHVCAAFPNVWVRLAPASTFARRGVFQRRDAEPNSRSD